MRRHLHNANERITAAKLNRISQLLEQQGDAIWERLFAANDDHLSLAEGESAYFPVDDCKVTHVGGDRSTGVTFEVGVGLGLKNLGATETDDDERKFQPVRVATAFTFQTDPSDITNPRIDRAFLKPKRVAQHAENVDVIDPVTKNIASSSLNTETAWTHEFAYVAGTPAGSPVAPPPPSGFVAEDAIAQILMPPGSGAFNPANLTDLRDLLELSSGLVPAITTFPASQVTVSGPLVDAHAQAALVRLDAALLSTLVRGLVQGRFEHVNTASVRIARGHRGLIRVEIDGVVLELSASDLDFTFPTHLDTGAEAASTWYYLYVFNSGGTLVPRISATAPISNPAQKVGYHPTHTTWRAVEIDGVVCAFRNDASSNIIPFDMVERAIYYRRVSELAIQAVSLGSVAPTSYSLSSLTGMLPETAREVLIHFETIGDGHAINVGHESLNGLDVQTNLAPREINAATPNLANSASVNSAEFWVPVDATPAIAWGRNAAVGIESGTIGFGYRIVGWR